MPATDAKTNARTATSNSLTITDNRTGKSYDLPIQEGTIRAMDLRQIRTGPEDFGLMTYDPAFGNTAACRSKITMIDGDRGILNYRGYPIEQLAEHSTYLDTGCMTSRTTPSCTRTSRSSSTGSATTRTPWGC